MGIFLRVFFRAIPEYRISGSESDVLSKKTKLFDSTVHIYTQKIMFLTENAGYIEVYIFVSRTHEDIEWKYVSPTPTSVSFRTARAH